MYDRPQKQFKHYDSSGIYNKQAAGEVAKKAQKYLFGLFADIFIDIFIVISLGVHLKAYALA